MRRFQGPSMWGGAAIASMLVHVWACGGSTPPDSCDVPALFAEKCNGGGCHGSAPFAQGLDLVSPGVENRVGNVLAMGCNGPMADPSNPTGSVLYQKVTDNPTCEARMPLLAQPLSESEITCIRDWIAGLRPPDEPEPDAGPDCAQCECTPNAVEPCYSGPPGTAGNGACTGGMRTCVPEGLRWVWSACEGEVLPIGEDCFTTEVDENCDGVRPPCGYEWAMAFGSANAMESQNVRSVALDGDGNVFVLGDFEGLVSFGRELMLSGGCTPDIACKADIFLAKYDRYGNHLWSKRFGDSSNQYAGRAVTDSSGNVVIVGRAFGVINFGGSDLDGVGTDDVFVAKFDGNGNHMWSRLIGGMDPDRSERVATDTAGNVIVTGAFTGTASLLGSSYTSAGLRDAFVVKIAANTGGRLFAMQIGGAGDDYGFGVTTDQNNNIFIAGRFSGEVTTTGFDLTSSGETDIFVAKLNPSGVPQWARGYGSSGPDSAYDVKVHRPSGDVIVTGYVSGPVNFGGGTRSHAGSRDIFLLRLTNSGSHDFSAVYGDEVDQFETSVAAETNTWSALDVDAAGNIYLTGPLVGSVTFDGGTLTSNGRPDIFYAKIAPDGDYLAGASFGSSGTEHALDIAVGTDGQVVLGGRMFGTPLLDLGASGVLQRRGDYDGFVASFLP